MHLTDEEERMLAGEEGEAARLSMQILTRIGGAYGAERMVPVSSVHAGCSCPKFSAAVEVIERFAELGGKFCTTTTVNPIINPSNTERWAELTESDALKQATIRQINAFQKMGGIPTWSCTPYFQGNLPRRGECISWVESSAIIFANSVLGARSNRTTMGPDIASAITGKVPQYGLLLDENRAGNVLVKVEFQPKDMFDYNNIGFIIGKACSGKVPVIEGLPPWTTANQLKTMGAASATKGGIALFHAVGITPEATTIESAFQGGAPEFQISIQDRDIKVAIEEMNTSNGDSRVDAVLVGCPHPTVSEIRELTELLNGKRVHQDIVFCLFASSDTISWARQMGYTDIIEAAGAKIFEGECIVLHIGVTGWGWKNVATNSAKYACTLPSDPTYLDVLYTDMKGCVNLATT